MDPIIVVGSGLAGYTLVREFRKLDTTTPVWMVTADAGDFYSKPMLSNALAQGRTPAQLVTTPGAQMSAQLGMRLFEQTRVLRIDAAAHVIETACGTFAYRQLVLALGADPVRLPLGGDAAAQVLSINDLADYARFRARLDGGASVAILGAGLIGCEFANDLAGAGIAVTVIDPAPYPLASLVPEAAGRELIEPLRRLGVHWHFGRAVRAVDRAAQGYRLTLDDGAQLEVTLVLSAVGLRPHTALARAAGLAVQRGIAVDAQLRTSDPDIFALGDCAEVDGRVQPFVLPIMHAARALARTLAGAPTAVIFPPMPVVVKTPACPIAVQAVARDAVGEWRRDGVDGGVKMMFIDAQQRLRGFVLTGARSGERQTLVKQMPG